MLAKSIAKLVWNLESHQQNCTLMAWGTMHEFTGTRVCITGSETTLHNPCLHVWVSEVDHAKIWVFIAPTVHFSFLVLLVVVVRTNVSASFVVVLRVFPCTRCGVHADQFYQRSAESVRVHTYSSKVPPRTPSELGPHSYKWRLRVRNAQCPPPAWKNSKLSRQFCVRWKAMNQILKSFPGQQNTDILSNQNVLHCHGTLHISDGQCSRNHWCCSECGHGRSGRCAPPPPTYMPVSTQKPIRGSYI